VSFDMRAHIKRLCP